MKRFRFSSLTISSKAELVMDVLKAVGWRLNKLRIYATEDVLPMLQLFESCPNLQYMELEECQYSNFYGPWPKQLFRSLLEASVSHTHGGPMPFGFIKKVETNFVLFLRQLN
jgi:hypothetical protein